MVYLPPNIAAKMREEARAAGDWALTEEGREDKFHVTALYGLHTDDPKEIAKALENEGPVMVTLGKTSLFQNDDADVLKAEVKSPDLHRINGKLAKLPHTNTHGAYVPHATLSYVKPGLGKKWAGSDALEGQQALIGHVVFSSKNGTKTTIPLKAKQAEKRTRPKMPPPT